MEHIDVAQIQPPSLTNQEPWRNHFNFLNFSLHLLGLILFFSKEVNVGRVGYQGLSQPTSERKIESAAHKTYSTTRLRHSLQVTQLHPRQASWSLKRQQLAWM